MKVIFVSAICLLTTACATQTPLERALSSDRTLVEKTSVELIGEKGYTAEEVSGEWINYHSPDGRKVVQLKGKEPKELTWRIRDDGVFCEDYYSRKGQEVCGDPVVRVKNSDGTYSDYFNGRESEFGTYRITEGNTNNF